MSTAFPEMKFGLVAVLDALGASNYDGAQIREFMAARATLGEIIRDIAKESGYSLQGCGNPAIFTFGDTVVISLTIDLAGNVQAQLARATVLLRRYMFHSIENKVLFRGAFSIGDYFEDADSNTVMGPAVADAAEWYEIADWSGLFATPIAATHLEYYADMRSFRGGFLIKYPVPLKASPPLDLYCVAWPSGFIEGDISKKKIAGQTPKQAYLEVVKDLRYPASAASKYRNTEAFFDRVAQELAADSG